MTQRDDLLIEELFATARAADVVMPAQLRAQLEADAIAALPAPMPRSFWQVIGGFWGASGLAAAMMMGLWIGIVPLETTASWADPVAYLSGADVSQDELAWGDFGWSLEEG